MDPLPAPRLVLASASPARLARLRRAGIEPVVVVSGADESAVTEPVPGRLALRLAELKAEAVAARIEPGPLVLGCDSVLEYAGEIYGKPDDAEDAVARWKRMRGGTGVLHTGHCLIDTATGRRAAQPADTLVRFAPVSDAEIAAYVATGEPLRVAGGFTIDGIGGPFVEGVDGDPGTVIGLSLPLLRRLLGELGLSITDLWTTTGEPDG
ncbi:MAG: Maf family protein [Micromonosporaceae bacterium]